VLLYTHMLVHDQSGRQVRLNLPKRRGNLSLVKTTFGSIIINQVNALLR
jgi:hypothetical protein